MKLMLRQMRKSRDLTQAQLADEVGTTLRVISAWERGETAISLADAARIADVFECSLDELAGREWPPTGLTPSEQQLVSDYRRMEPEDRETIDKTARTFALAGDSKKEVIASPPPLAIEDVKL